MQASNIVMLAGGIAFVGSFKESGGFPANGYAVIGGTVGLVFLFTLTNGTAIEPPVKVLAGLMVLAAVYAYVPALSTKSTKKKDKKHG